MPDVLTKPDFFGELKVGDRFIYEEKLWVRVDESREEFGTNARTEDGQEISWFGPTAQVEKIVETP